MSLITTSIKPLHSQHPDCQKGIGMVEVLIALVLITSTLLGATAMQLTSMQTNRGAYYRTQASILAYDIADRIRFNADYALAAESNYAIDTASAAGYSVSTCITDTTGCSAQQLRDRDVLEWSENFYDVTGIGQDGGAYQPVLPNGLGTVSVSGATFSVQVSWNELEWTAGANGERSDSTRNFTLDFTLAD